MRRRLQFFLSISYLGFVLLWGAASVAYQLDIVESPLLKNALMLITGTFCILGALLFLWRGAHRIRSEWHARA